MASWAIIEKEGTILFVERSGNTSRPHQWCFPGGGIKPGESPEEACLREVREETGLRVAVEEYVLEKEGSHYFRCRLTDEEQQVMLKENECCDFRWVVPLELCNLGSIMDLKTVAPLLQSLGFVVSDDGALEP